MINFIEIINEILKFTIKISYVLIFFIAIRRLLKVKKHDE